MRALIIVTFVVLISQNKAYSCSCAFKPTFIEAVKSAKYIFSGIAISEDTICYDSYDTNWVLISEEEAKNNDFAIYYRRFKLEILITYKGIFTSQSIFVETPFSGPACGFNFKIGYKYIVYSDGDKIDNSISTSRCDRTMENSESEHKKLEKCFLTK